LFKESMQCRVGVGDATGSLDDAYQKGFCWKRIQHWISLNELVREVRGFPCE
jgi:hypothetical protein